MSEQMVANSAFEGLFVRALQVSGPAVNELKAAGFDPAKMEIAYPVEVWRRCLDVAAKAYYPLLSAEKADFELGYRLVDGYLETLIGRVIGATFPLLGPDALCTRLPRFMLSGVKGQGRFPEVAKVEDGHYRFTMFGSRPVPWFTAGSVTRVLAKTGVTPRVSVAATTPDSFTLEIRW